MGKSYKQTIIIHLGCVWGGLSLSTGTENRYRYNGKEFHQEFNLGLYDYGARMYDPSIGRWNGVDALAEKFTSWSPYNYVLGNPLRLTDPDGREVIETASATTYTGADVQNYFRYLQARYGSQQSRDPGPNDDPTKLRLQIGNYNVLGHGTLSGGITFYNGALRTNYAIRTRMLIGLYDATGQNYNNIRLGYLGRYKFKAAARENMIFTRNLAAILNSHSSTSNSLKTHVPGSVPSRFYLSDWKFNAAGGAGLILGAGRLAYSGYSVYSAEDKLRQTTIELGNFGGAWAGGEIGAYVGSYGGPWGAVLGAVAFGMIGGTAGGATAESIYDNGWQMLKDLYNGVMEVPTNFLLWMNEGFSKMVQSAKVP